MRTTTAAMYKLELPVMVVAPCI